MGKLEIIFDLPFGFTIHNIISLSLSLTPWMCWQEWCHGITAPITHWQWPANCVYLITSRLWNPTILWMVKWQYAYGLQRLALSTMSNSRMLWLFWRHTSNRMCWSSTRTEQHINVVLARCFSSAVSGSTAIRHLSTRSWPWSRSCGISLVASKQIWPRIAGWSICRRMNYVISARWATRQLLVRVV